MPMRFYRVHPWLSSAKPGENGHPLYVWPKQGSGRIDNPPHYLALYVADSAQAAVGERFGNQAIWSDDMLLGPKTLPGSVLALSVYEGAPSVLHLDDAQVLLDQGLRPSRVVTRHKIHTQAWALAIYLTVGGSGVSWWSYHDPDWVSMGLWDTGYLTVVSTTRLVRGHPALISAAAILRRAWK